MSQRLRRVVVSSWLVVATLDALAAEPLAVPIDRGSVLRVMRRAAERDDGPARRMLASLLEESNRPGPEALRLYLSAQRNSDERAAERLDRLREQGVAIPFALAADDGLPDAGEIVPVGRTDDPQAPGYHCHVLRAGQMWCHSGMD